MVSDFIPLFDYFANYKPVDSVVDGLLEIFVPLVEKSKSKHDPENPKCAIDHLINAINNQKDKSIYTIDCLPRFVIDVFLAGTETTSKTIEWFILLMTNNENDCQTKLFNELVSKDNKSPFPIDKDNYPYFNASITEVSRYRLIAPTIIPRCVSDSVSLGGYLKLQLIILKLMTVQ